jgi:hypothetical protein
VTRLRLYELYGAWHTIGGLLYLDVGIGVIVLVIGLEDLAILSILSQLLYSPRRPRTSAASGVPAGTES